MVITRVQQYTLSGNIYLSANWCQIGWFACIETIVDEKSAQNEFHRGKR